MFTEFLTEIGLSEKEALLYVELLKVDSDSISSLSKKTNINRTTVYPVIEQLIQKGLAEEISHESKALYRAFSPDRLQTYIEAQQIKLRESHNKAIDIIPQLKAITHEDGQRPIVEYYEGKKAILRAVNTYYSLSADVTEVYLIYPRDILEGFFEKEDLEQARKIRIEKKIRSKSIYTYTKGEYSPDTTGDRFRVNEKKYPIKSDIEIMGDRVYIHVLGDKAGSVFIKNQDIADTMRTLFKIALEGLEEKRKQ